jgi:hypothetical protein
MQVHPTSWCTPLLPSGTGCEAPLSCGYMLVAAAAAVHGCPEHVVTHSCLLTDMLGAAAAAAAAGGPGYACQQTAAISLWLQNFFDDVASWVERAVALVCWTDPIASAMFLLVLLAGTAGLAVAGLRPALVGAGLLLLRPPWLRGAAPAAPLRFFWRLPHHSPQ